VDGRNSRWYAAPLASDFDPQRASSTVPNAPRPEIPLLVDSGLPVFSKL